MQTVIVTGASKGIGAAICKVLRSRGVRVIGVARSAKLLQEGDVAGDVSDPETARRVVTQAGDSLVGLVLNAGVITPVSKVIDTDIAQFKATYEVNLFSTLSWIQAALPALRKNKGRLLYVTTELAGMAGFACYASSKVAMNSMIATLAEEERDVVMLAVSPGVVATDMFGAASELGKSTLSKEHQEFFKAMKKSDEVSQPETVAEVFTKLILSATPDKSGSFLTWKSPYIQGLLK
ncbi:hypothetical protein PSACC_03709 [Paramicrosporidium saccamoebae]|uniref:Uncharacterized protein n=1 Tax=Paramicrosporidium saccamoebae TaxID=1246581 RepID=A0A2H9TFI6_9FUNG|nr:hypothetical protein PSACC_03709 [Paramicrosporidium saccamoebae]